MDEFSQFLFEKKIEKILVAFFCISEKMNIDYIKAHVLHMEDKIASDFLAIKKYKEEKEIKNFCSQFKIYLYSLIGLRTKSFYNALELQNTLEVEQEDYEYYLENFGYIEEDLKNKLYHILNTYLQIIESGSKTKEEDFKELYAFYQTIMICIFHLLPRNYRQSLINQENFKDLKQEIRIIKYEETFKNTDFKKSYISWLEDYIRKYILAKYGIDLFEFHESRERKRI